MVLAHQGGWDEALFVVVPMVVLAGLLALAQRRARAEGEADHGVDERDGAGAGGSTAARPSRDG